MYGAFITKPDGTERKVKNLGWLLRHWKEVERIYVTTFPTQPAAVMRVIMRDGTVYRTGWASVDVLVAWLHRPTFYNTTVCWDGAWCVVGHKSGYTYTNDSGSNRWICRAVANP